MDNNNRQSPYRYAAPSQPLPFPEADRQFNRNENPSVPHHSAVTIPMNRYSPTTPSTFKSNSPDATDSAPKYFDVTRRGVPVFPPGQVPIASPEVEDNNVPVTPRAVEVEVRHEHDTHGMVDAVKTDETRYLFSVRTVVEILSILVALIPMVVAPRLGAYQRGFYYNDPDIKYPFKEGTVKPWLLYLFCLTLPAFVVILGEICHFYRSKTRYGDAEVQYRLWSFGSKRGPVVLPVLVSIVRIFALFTYGFLITKSVTDIAKYSVGRLRPHFLDVCDPDFDRIHAEGGPDRYIMESDQYVCRNFNSTDPKVQYRIRDSRLSFLSGHASMAFYSMFFLIFYLESRLRWMDLRYCKAILQFGLFLLAALTGLSRISDHKVFVDFAIQFHRAIGNHGLNIADVFAGTVLGLVMCAVTVFFIGNFFNDRRFMRYKLIGMLQKLDWETPERSQLARLLAAPNCPDPGIRNRFEHFIHEEYPKTA